MNAISSKRVFVAPRRRVVSIGDTAVMAASFAILFVGLVIDLPLVWGAGLIGYLGTLFLQTTALRDELAAKTSALVDAALLE